jgi:hypothetical protein
VSAPREPVAIRRMIVTFNRDDVEVSVTYSHDHSEAIATPGSKKRTTTAARMAREAYRYVARTHPLDANLEPLGVADARVVEAEERGDWPAYVEALRELCRTARREAQRRAAA